MPHEGDYWERMSAIGTELYQDPLSEVTRRRQITVVLLAAGLMAVGRGIVKIKSGEIGGIGFEPAGTNEIVLLLELLVAATLPVFWIGAWADSRLRHSKRLPLIEQAEAINSALKRDLRERATRVEILDERMDRILERRQALLNEFYARPLQERQDHREALEVTMKGDGLDEAQAELQQMVMDKSIIERLAILLRTLRLARILDAARFGIEVAVPTLLALFAMYVGLR